MNNRDLTGRAAPAFALPDTEGRSHGPENHLGHWLLLVFHRHLA